MLTRRSRDLLGEGDERLAHMEKAIFDPSQFILASAHLGPSQFILASASVSAPAPSFQSLISTVRKF